MAAHRYTANDRASIAWDHLKVVLALREGGSLSGAGRLLDVDHTTVARKLLALERDLGGPLFERSGIGLSPTSLGEEVIAAAERMGEEITSLLRRLDGAPIGPTGLVRLTATPFLAASLFAPAVGEFLRDHPGLQLELIGDNRSLDLSRREADIAVRLGAPTTPALVAKRIGRIAFAFYAAARDDREFESQDFLTYTDESASGALPQYLTALVPHERIVLRSNSLQALVTAVRSGAGCGLLPCFTSEGDPALRRVKTHSPMPPLDLWLAYHEDLRRSPRVKAASAFVENVVGLQRHLLLPAGFGPRISASR